MYSKKAFSVKKKVAAYFMPPPLAFWTFSTYEFQTETQVYTPESRRLFCYYKQVFED